MKQGKKPTVAQRKFIEDKNLNFKNWLVIKDTPSLIEIVHRETKNIKKYYK